MRKNLILATLAISSIFVACNNNGSDNNIEPTKPTILLKSLNHPIQSLLICDEVSDHVIKLEPGDTLGLEININSVIELSQFKIDIHENGDCHDHAERPLSDWNYTKVFDISGKSTIETVKIIVPENAEHSNYHFKIQAVDESGIESEAKNMDLIVH